MKADLIHIIWLSGAFLALFATAEILFQKFKFKAEVTRKIVHIVTGILTLLFPIVLTSHWSVLFLCSSFLVILLLSMKFGKLKSINGVARETMGSLIYPVIVYLCFLLLGRYQNPIFYYLPILVLAIADPMAAFVGKRYPKGHYTIFGHTKTLSGSLGFAMTAYLLSGMLLLIVEKAPLGETIVFSIILALATSVAEAVSHKGYDNLTIPLTTVLLLVTSKELFTFF